MTSETEDSPPSGIALELAAGLRRIIAPNPSPMTYWGTNTYILGMGGLAVIDPGPDHDAHLAAILDAVMPSQSVTHVIVSHTHLDHSPLARRLARETGARVFGFGGPQDGRSAVMQRLARSGYMGGGEGIDTHFSPDTRLQDGEIIEGDGWTLEVLHTPGHLGNHICLGWGDSCFTADHVMGWASSLVSPPDGDLTQFMASCRRLAARSWARFYPGHGPAIDDPDARLSWLIAHRLQREAEILAALHQAPATVGNLTRQIYTDTPHRLLPAAERNVFAHLVDLHEKSAVTTREGLSPQSVFDIARAHRD